MMRLENIINSLYYGEDKMEFTESQDYMLYKFFEWSRLTLIFLPNDKKTENRLNHPDVRRAGGMWHWINNTDIDLSFYGIFNEFNPDNYKYGCFIQAMENSGVLTPEEIKLLKASVNTRHIPVDELDHVACYFNLDIAL